MSESFLDGKVTLHRGDCLDVLPLLEENSIDSCVCDPPYHLTVIKSGSCFPGRREAIKRGESRGFMGKQWDGGDIAFRPEVWAEVLRVLKPGAHLLAFSGTRTYHRMACAIEDAGFEIRDQIGWCYGSGFPKSHDVSKGIDRMAGAEREVVGRNSAARISVSSDKRNREQGKRAREYGSETGCDITAPATEHAIQWQGWGTALKPAWEPICLARKPLSESSIAANVLKHGTGGINVGGCRIGVGTDKMPSGANGQPKNPLHGGDIKHSSPVDYSSGRWPANLIHDGSEEVLAGFPEGRSAGDYPSDSIGTGGGTTYLPTKPQGQLYADSGSAARFFASFPITDEDLSWSHRANGAERCSLQCHRRSEKPVPDIVPRKWFQSLVQNVKSAGNLCDSCATDIAVTIAELRQAPNPDLHRFRDSIGERNAQILTQSLVHYVAERASTDTITTIPSLKQLFGSVFHAIETCIEASGTETPAPNGSSRLFYSSKADADDRLGSKHPTVKPLDLIQYLARLVTPRGGTILDCFAGTGTTGEAAWREGMAAVLIEREPEYQADIVKRMGLCLSGPEERRAASVKQLPPDDLPMFGGGI